MYVIPSHPLLATPTTLTLNSIPLNPNQTPNDSSTLAVNDSGNDSNSSNSTVSTHPSAPHSASPHIVAGSHFGITPTGIRLTECRVLPTNPLGPLILSLISAI